MPQDNHVFSSILFFIGTIFYFLAISLIQTILRKRKESQEIALRKSKEPPLRKLGERISPKM